MSKYFLFLIVLLCSCTNTDTIEIPGDIMPRDKMAKVMLDIHLLEATMNSNVAYNDKTGPGSTLNINVYKKNGITKEEFDASYKFYTENPEALAEVYQLVLNDLSKMQAATNNEK